MDQVFTGEIAVRRETMVTLGDPLGNDGPQKNPLNEHHSANEHGAITGTNRDETYPFFTVARILVSVSFASPKTSMVLGL